MSWRATSPGYIIEEYVGNSLVDNGLNVTQMVHQEVIQVRVVLLWYSEIMAIQLAAEICVHKGFTNVVIETDSTIARLIMIQEVSAPWAVDTIVRKIITLLRDKKMRFSHVYREGNAVADSLANYAIDEEISGTFEEFHQLPAQARKLINVDKAQIPSVRVRVHPWRF